MSDVSDYWTNINIKLPGLASSMTKLSSTGSELKGAMTIIFWSNSPLHVATSIQLSSCTWA